MSDTIEHWHHDHCSGLEQILKGGELIRRQMAIDALKQQAETMSEWSNRYAEQRKGVLTAVNIIEDLPSAEPKIIRCEDCKYGMLDPSFPHQWFCKFKGNEWNNGDYFCGHARKREVTE